VLFPCTDSAVVAISRARAELERRYRIALPEHEVVVRLLDKSRFYRFAIEHQLPIPRTMFLRSLDDCREAALRLSFPCALKPPVKTAAWTSVTNAKVFEVRDFEELLELWHRVGSAVDELILQEWIPGGDENLFTCYGYFDADSNPLVLYESHKLRQWPPNTGSGTLAELVQVRPAREATVDLVRCAGHQGLIFVQFKRHPRTGEYFIVEPNVGRPGLGMPIGEAGGAEILLTMYCDAAGLPLPRSRRVTRPAKWICWKRDFASAIHSVRRGDLGVREWLASLIGVKATADWRWDDPLPFLVDLLGSPTRMRRQAPEHPAPRLQVRPPAAAPETGGHAPRARVPQPES
jgi:predicted ATP-grasp superfamily ATP-dependent carboligase